MANKIVLKKSSVAAKVPLSTDLDVGELAVNLVDQKLYSKKADGTVVLVGSGLGGSGDVQGPVSSTDNAITRFDGATGKIIQNSVATVDDSGNISVLSNSSTGTGADTIPVGTTAQRPTGATGKIRYNSTLGTPEWYDPASTAFVPFADPAPASYYAEVLVIGGGGSGGVTNGGGGGAGAVYICEQVLIMKGKAYTVTIGAGGAGSTSSSSNGSATRFGQIYALGGGAGDGSIGAGQTKDGGSGGGGRGEAGTSGGRGLDGRGNPGGAGYVSPRTSAGGGGAGGGGNDGSNGIGGPAITLAGYADICAAGVSGKFAGGGGGGTEAVDRTASGGGGGAGNSGNNSNGVSATANTGSGGGGGSRGSSSSSGPWAGGNGGSGIVIVRYYGSQVGSGGTVYQAGGMTYHKFTSSSTYTG